MHGLVDCSGIIKMHIIMHTWSAWDVNIFTDNPDVEVTISFTKCLELWYIAPEHMKMVNR